MRPPNLYVFALLGVLLAVTLSSAATAGSGDGTVLPTRVSNPMQRAKQCLNAAELSIDAGSVARATPLLTCVRLNVIQANKAARKELTAPPTDPESDTGPGPGSVAAVLTLENTAITRLSGLLDGKQDSVVAPISPALLGTLSVRDALVTAVTRLDPEGAGADYADGMSDIQPDFDDEVANLEAALTSDQLSPAGRQLLVAALAQSKKTQAKMAKAFGGGE